MGETEGSVPVALAAPAEVPGGALELADVSTPVDREVLFRYQGKAYLIPAAFELGDSLTYVNLSRHFGADIAADWAMELALGVDGYAVLRSVRGLSPEKLDAIVAMVTARVAGTQVPKA